MALDKNSNGFTFGFAAVLVIVVGTILATLAVVLKEPQQANLKQEKMKAILGLKEITEEQLDLLFTIVSGKEGLRARRINMQHLTTEQKQELNLDGLKLNPEDTNE